MPHVELGTEPVQRQEIVVPETFEPILVLPPVDFQLRLEAPQLLNVLNVEAISRSGAPRASAVAVRSMRRLFMADPSSHAPGP